MSDPIEATIPLLHGDLRVLATNDQDRVVTITLAFGKNSRRTIEFHKYKVHQKWFPPVINRAAALWAEGKSLTQVAREMKMTRGEVANITVRNRELFPHRGSPIIRRPAPTVSGPVPTFPTVGKPARPQPLQHGAHTLPPLPSEMAK